MNTLAKNFWAANGRSTRIAASWSREAAGERCCLLIAVSVSAGELYFVVLRKQSAARRHASDSAAILLAVPASLPVTLASSCKRCGVPAGKGRAQPDYARPGMQTELESRPPDGPVIEVLTLDARQLVKVLVDISVRFAPGRVRRSSWAASDPVTG